MGLPRLSIVTLGVADLARSRAFYGTLGFELSARSQETICFFRMAGSVLALYERGLLADDASVPDDGQGFTRVTLAMCLDSEAEVDQEWQRWVDVGAAPARRPHRAEWGGYSSYVADLDGHLWELAYNPFFRLEADGSLQLSR